MEVESILLPAKKELQTPKVSIKFELRSQECFLYRELIITNLIKQEILQVLFKFAPQSDTIQNLSLTGDTDLEQKS